MLASIIYNYGKFCDDFKSTLKLGAYTICKVGTGKRKGKHYTKYSAAKQPYGGIK